MATKQFYATGGFKYYNRMMTSGEPVMMDAPTARLYMALGKITATKPRSAKPVEAEAPVEAAPKPRRRRKKTA